MRKRFGVIAWLTATVVASGAVVVVGNAVVADRVDSVLADSPPVAAQTSSSTPTPSMAGADSDPATTLSPRPTPSASAAPKPKPTPSATARPSSGAKSPEKGPEKGAEKGPELSVEQKARRAEVEAAARLAASPSPSPTPAPTPTSFSFVVSSFNALGSQHTAPGGKDEAMASGVVRTRWAVRLLTRHNMDVVGFQEFRADQWREFARLAGTRYDGYPGLQLGRRETVNSIVWRRDVWDLVSTGTVDVPYFRGELRPRPVVLLEHKQTGLRAYFANFHNPATLKQFGDAERWRDMATRIEIRLANRLRATGIPVFFTGDMNEREEFFCKLTAGAPMTAANGGSNSGACRPPGRMPVDWIFGSPGVAFSDYVRDRSPLVVKTTDHPVIVARAMVRGTDPAIGEAGRALVAAARASSGSR